MGLRRGDSPGGARQGHCAKRHKAYREGNTNKLESRDIREVQVSEWWRSGAIKTVVTTEGRYLRVLYPGRPMPHAGPDFRDTLLITEEGDLIRGDTEVHLRRRDWDGHGHRGDPRYDRVVLHLFLRGGGRPPEPGTQVQEVMLGDRGNSLTQTGKPPKQLMPQPGVVAPLERLSALPLPELEQALEEAGEKRFLGAACAFTRRLRAGDAQEELYTGVMEALGYSQNSAPMELLARGLPLRRLRELAGPGMDTAALEAILLGAAGLLHRQLSLGLPDIIGDDSRAREMEAVWRAAGSPAVVPSGMWSNAGLRPHNRPARRLAGAAALIRRHRDGGLLEGLGDTLQSKRAVDLERALVVVDNGSVPRLSDTHNAKTRAPALIGKNRAREIIINVLLPFFYARAHLLGDPGLGRRCLELYRSFPPGQENEVTREMKGLLGLSRERRHAINSAGKQQGLIHLYGLLSGQDERETS